MIGEIVRHYQGKGSDLEALKTRIAGTLELDGFQVQASVPSPHGNVIQARKGGFLSSIIAADRALTILVAGTPADFTVRIGVGKWLEHIAVTAVETLLLSTLFLPVDVAETLWNLEVENKIAKEIDAAVDKPDAGSSAATAPAAS